MLSGFHQAYHRILHKGTAKKYARNIDRYAYLMGFAAVTINFPQLYDVWTKPDIAGVSLVSWTGFMVSSAFWLYYGMVHKARTLVVINGMLIVVQGLIVLRLLLSFLGF